MFLFLTAVDCGSLPDPANGRVDHTAGTSLGQTATYSCNTGYNLVGNSTRTCQAEGNWSGNTPTCQGMSLKGDLSTFICVCAQHITICPVWWVIFHRAKFSRKNNLLNHKNVHRLNVCGSKFLKFIC